MGDSDLAMALITTGFEGINARLDESHRKMAAIEDGQGKIHERINAIVATGTPLERENARRIDHLDARLGSVSSKLDAHIAAADDMPNLPRLVRWFSNTSAFGKAVVGAVLAVLAYLSLWHPVAVK